MTEFNLPSGAVLKVLHIPFPEAMALNEAVLEELKGISFDSQTEMVMVYKDLFCVGFSSQKIKAALWKCFGRCTYNDLKIDQSTFEPEEARQDYADVCMEVAKGVLLPFVKSHSAKYSALFETLKNSPESKPKTTPS